MKAIALSFVAALAMGGSAFAAEHERAPAKAKPECVTVAKLKDDLKGAKFTPLNISQYHFMMGAYAATPPVGLPADTDNGLLVQLKDKAFVVWMEAECASKTPPMQISPQFVAILRAIAPVAGEASDDSKDELHL